MPVNAEKILKEYEALKGRRSLWEQRWQELAEYIVPRKASVLTQVLGGGGEKRTKQMFDSTAPRANQKLAAAIHGSLTSPVLRWFNLKMRADDLNRDSEIALWLEKVKNKMFLAIQQSNFDAEIQEVYTDLGAFGTAALYSEEVPDKADKEGFGGFRFEALPIGSYVIDEDREGRITRLYRAVSLTLNEVANKWGEEKLPDQLREKLKSDKSKFDDRIIIHAVTRREGAKLEASPTTPANKLPFSSVYIDEELKHLINEGGFHEFPFAVPRWSKQTGEVYGRGQGEIALPDIKTLNKEVELYLKALAKAVDPSLLVKHRGVIGRIRTMPSGITFVRENDNIRPLDPGAKFNIVEQNKAELRAAIQEIFFNDQLQLPDKSIITATEADRRLELMQRILGPTLGRLDDELLRALVDRLFGIMLRAGSFDPIPGVLVEAAKQQGGDIEVEYDGPLAKAQRASQLTSAAEFIDTIPVLEQIEPGVKDNVNFDAVLRDSHSQRSLPAEWLKSEREVAALREARAQAAREQAETDQAEQIASAVGQGGPGVKALAEVGQTRGNDNFLEEEEFAA